MDGMDGMEEIVEEFLVESRDDLDRLDRELVALEREPGSRSLLASVFRTFHTIKGTSGFLALHRLERVAHAGEDLLAGVRDGVVVVEPVTVDVLLTVVDAIRALLDALEASGAEGDLDVEPVVARVGVVLAGAAPAPAPAPPGAAGTGGDHRRRSGDASVRVDVDVLDDLARLAAELVQVRDEVLLRVPGPTDDPELARVAQHLSSVAEQLRTSVLRTRTQPIEVLWAKMPRVVRDLAAQCGRQVHLDLVGRETEVDRSVLEAVRGPLTHLVRNAVDHGIEAPAARTAAGKPREGVLRLAARHERGQVVVEVSDDGRGIDPAIIGTSAVRKGLVSDEALGRMARDDVLQLIFTPGFSTAAAITRISGRGVGMDVVKTDVEAAGGTIEVESVAGRGTTCRLRIPLPPVAVRTVRGPGLVGAGASTGRG